MTETNQADELAVLKAELASMRAELSALQAERRPPEQITTVATTVAPSRRRMLKKVGIVAAGLLAAGALANASGSPALADDDKNDPDKAKFPPPPTAPGKDTTSFPSPSPRPNATGGNFIIGGDNEGSDNSTTTVLRVKDEGVAILTPYLLAAVNSNGTRPGLPGSAKLGLVALTSGSDSSALNRVGVFGSAAGAQSGGFDVGVWGNANTGQGLAIYGFSSLGRGVVGNSDSNVGVDGLSTYSYGVRGTSTNLYGAYFYGGRANIALQPQGQPGVNLNPHNAGELVEDSVGNLWVCVVTGNPGTWRKLGGPATAGSLHLFPTPGRFVDTRVNLNSSGAVPGFGPGAPNSNNVRTYQIANATGQPTSGGAYPYKVPYGATAITGTITAVPGSATNGYLVGWPTGAPVPTTSVVNYTPSSAEATSYILALSAAGQLSIAAYSTANVIIDITGYYL